MKYDNYCKFCEKTVTSSRALSYHLRMTHNMSRKEYVVETEYEGIAPQCENDNCDQEAYFEFSKFGKFCSAKCRANNDKHLQKSVDTLIEAQNKNSKHKKDHYGMTIYEWKLWKEGHLKRLGFDFQRIINFNSKNKFVREKDKWVRVDFLNEEFMLVIELDGWSHESSVNEDSRRDKRLGKLGYTVLRFTNDDVKNNFEKVVRRIKRQLKI